MAPLAPRHPDAVAAAAAAAHARPARRPGRRQPLTLAQSINPALADVLDDRGRTRWCSARTSRARAACTASPAGCASGSARPGSSTRCSTSRPILGLALGAGLSGLLPIPEIQYLAYLHNAEDQLRGEAATLQFFSNGQYRNPMVVRIAGYAYQKGFGGHFHNDNAVGVLRDIPGLVVASPAAARRRRRDAAHLRRRGRGRRPRLRVPRADRAVPHAATCTSPATTAGSRRTPEPAAHVPIGRARGCTATAPT